MNHQTFARVHQNQVELGSFRATIESTERSRTFDEGVIYAMDQNLGTNERELAVAAGRCRTHHILQSFISVSYAESAVITAK